MGLKVVRKKAAVATAVGAVLGASILGVSMLSAGCQQQSAPLRMSVISDQAGPDRASADALVGKDSPYVNPDWRDTDDASSNIFVSVLSQTGSAIGNFFSPVIELSVRSVGFFTDDKPSHAYKLLVDPNSPDNRREGMNRLADFGFLTSAIFRKECRLMAQNDPDVTVRASAIRTSNRARDGQATSIFINGLADRNESIRMESAKGLANVPDVKAADSLVALLNNREEERDIRVASADALKHYRTLTVARSLTSALDDKNFAIAWQARRSLRYLTDRDYGYSGGAWLAYFTGPENPFK